MHTGFTMLTVCCAQRVQSSFEIIYFELAAFFGPPHFPAFATVLYLDLQRSGKMNYSTWKPY